MVTYWLCVLGPEVAFGPVSMTAIERIAVRRTGPVSSCCCISPRQRRRVAATPKH